MQNVRTRNVWSTLMATGYGVRNLPRMPAKQPLSPSDHPVAQMFAHYRQAGLQSIGEPFRGVTNDYGKDLLRQHVLHDHAPNSAATALHDGSSG